MRAGEQATKVGICSAPRQTQTHWEVSTTKNWSMGSNREIVGLFDGIFA